MLTPAADRDPASAHRRLARVLKALGRAHGFVNLGVELLPAPAANPASSTADAADASAMKTRKTSRQAPPRFVGWQCIGSGAWEAVATGDTEHACRKALLRSPCPDAGGRDLCVLPAGRVPPPQLQMEG